MKNLQILEGTAPLLVTIINKFGINENQLIPYISTLLLISTIVLILFSAWLIKNLLSSKKLGFKKIPSYTFLSATITVIIIILIGPTLLIGSNRLNERCHADVLYDYDQAGSQIQQIIEPGAVVYWCGGKYVTPLLYIPNAKIFTPVLNGIYSMRVGGDRNSLEKAGYYNKESLDIWLEKSDYMLCDNRILSEYYLDMFEQVYKTAPINNCEGRYNLKIYKRYQ